MLTALIVEDNPEFSVFLKSLLELRFPNAMISHASDADEAMRHFRLNKLDIVLVDISLPGGVNGLEFTQWVRQEGTSPPVVILTNHDLPEYRLEAVRVGADRFLSKTSSTTEEIVAAIEELVGKRATREGSNEARRGPLTLPNTYG